MKPSKISFSERIYYVMEKNDSFAGKSVDIFILVLISLNVIFVILESFKNIYERWQIFFTLFETFSVIVFTIEYALRLLSAPYKFKTNWHVLIIWKQITSPMSIVDLAAIIPFYLPLLFPIDLRFIRILRMFRLFKIGRYSKTIIVLQRVFISKKNELFLTILILFVAIFFSGAMMYYLENPVQPQNFSDIISSIKWTIRTMIFLGYSNFAPHSLIGKALGMLIVVLGLGWLTLPFSIINSGLAENVSKKPENYCPTCGKELLKDSE